MTKEEIIEILHHYLPHNVEVTILKGDGASGFTPLDYQIMDDFAKGRVDDVLPLLRPFEHLWQVVDGIVPMVAIFRNAFTWEDDGEEDDYPIKVTGSVLGATVECEGLELHITHDWEFYYRYTGGEGGIDKNFNRPDTRATLEIARMLDVLHFNWRGMPEGSFVLNDIA